MVRLISRRPSKQELLRRLIMQRDGTRKVIGHFVVISGQHPGEGGMGCLEIRVGLVEGIPGAILIERDAFRTPELPPRNDQFVAKPTLIDVVAYVDHEIQILVGQVAKGGVVAVLVVLAGRQAELQPGGMRVGGWGRPGSTDGANLTTGKKPVPVHAVRFEPLNFRMDGVGELRVRGALTFAYDPAKPLIRRNFPTDPE